MNYILSIDGNYNSDFEVEFYFNLLSKFYLDKGLQISKYSINSGDSELDIVENLNEIRELCKKKNNLILINGSVAEPIVSDLHKFKAISSVFSKYEEVARVYRQIAQVNSLVNILLIKNNEDKELENGFKMIDSLSISVGFDFKVIDITDDKLMENYRQILGIIKEKGWEAPPLED
jgi:hypothetical protein